MDDTILIFSDTHLTPRPDVRKLNFLLSILEQADTVILNGDFWDSYLTTIQSFVASTFWQPLFEALIKKSAIYLYGNHDPKVACHGLEKAFSVQQATDYTFTQSGQTFHLEHGNRIVPELDELHPLPRPLLTIASLTENFFIRTGKQLFLRRYCHKNEAMKEWQKANAPSTTYLLCGHSHYAELDSGDLYANSGVIRGGLGSYILIKDGLPKVIIVDY